MQTLLFQQIFWHFSENIFIENSLKNLFVYDSEEILEFFILNFPQNFTSVGFLYLLFLEFFQEIAPTFLFFLYSLNWPENHFQKISSNYSSGFLIQIRITNPTNVKMYIYRKISEWLPNVFLQLILLALFQKISKSQNLNIY